MKKTLCILLVLLQILFVMSTVAFAVEEQEDELIKQQENELIEQQAENKLTEEKAENKLTEQKAENKLTEQKAENKLTEQQAVLGVLGIVDSLNNIEIDIKKTVSRVDFLKYILKLLKVKPTTYTSEQDLFRDISFDDENADVVYTSLKMNLINANPNAEFRPDDTIIFAEAVKITVCALGYNVMLGDNPNYPTSYMFAAQTNDLLKKITIDASGKLTLGDCANLLYNALTADMIKLTGISGLGVKKYEKIKDVSLLTENFMVVKNSGTLVANERTGLSNKLLKAARGYVKIDGSGGGEYKIGKTKIDDLLGYNVTYYVSKSNADIPDTLLYISPTPNKNNVTRVSAKDIAFDSPNFTLQRFVYTDHSGSEKSIQLSNAYNVIYNGICDTLFNINVFDIKAGEIILVDNKGDGDVDAVLINEYESFFVSSVGEKQIIDMNSQTINIDDTVNERVVTVYKDGVIAEKTDISPNTVVSVYRSKTGTNDTTLNSLDVKIAISDKVIEGKLTEVSNTSPYSKIVINKDSLYDISNDYNKYDVHMDVGDSGKFYLDFEDRLVYAVKSIKDYEYAFLMDIKMKPGLDGKVEISYLSIDGEIEIRELKSKIMFNGEQIKAHEILSIENGLSVPNVRINRQVIKFKINEDDKIYEIYTAVDNTNSNVGYSTDGRLSLDYKLKSGNGYLRYAPVALLIASKYSVLPTAKVFVVPVNSPKFDEEYFDTLWRLKDNDIWVTDSQILRSNLNNINLTLDVYDSTEQYDASLFVYYTTNSNISHSYVLDMAIVSGVSSVIGKDGNNYFNIKYYMKGKEESKVVSDANLPVIRIKSNFTAKLISGLVKGDIIQFTTNKNEQIDQVRLLYSSDFTGTDFELKNQNTLGELYVEPDAKDAYGALYVGYGTVQKILSEKIVLRINEYMRIFRFSGNVYIYNQSTEKIKVGSKKDISVGDKIFLRASVNSLKDICIFR